MLPLSRGGEVVDVDGATVDTEPQYSGCAAAIVVASGQRPRPCHPLAEHPLPISGSRLVELGGGYEDPVLALP